MDRLEAMRVFCTVVDTGSFAAAAERLNVSTSAVSRWVAQLESHLQARLLNRTTRRIGLTESGQAYYERCAQWLQELEAIESAVGEQSLNPQGTLRITTSVGFALNYLSPALAEARQRFPQLQFHVSLSGRVVDLVEEGFDLALRIGPVGSQHLVAREIGRTTLLHVASPDYLASAPPLRQPDDLGAHDCLLYEHDSDKGQWRFTGPDGQRHEVKVSGSVQSDNSEFLMEMAAQGQGVFSTPCYIARPHLEAGRVVRVLPEYESETLPIYAVYPNRKHLSAKVRAFTGFFAEWMRERSSIRLAPDRGLEALAGIASGADPSDYRNRADRL